MTGIYVKEFIVSHMINRGDGKSMESPFRPLVQVLEKDGSLVAEHDQLGNYAQEDLISLINYCKQNNEGNALDVLNNWRRNK